MIAGLWLATAAPAVFFFVAVQYSALTFPFWDHCELGRLLIRIHDEGFRLSYLWAPHTHARPLTYRAVLLANAWLTDWDIRSEYVYLYAAFYGAFLVQAFALWRISGGSRSLRFPASLAALSVFSFSPVAHNTHWWSLMIMIIFAHFFIVGALVSLALNSARWRNQILSVAACWLALYSVSNGLVAFAAAAIVSQVSEQQPFRVTRRSVFWIANVVLALAVYMPGNTATEVTNKPGPLALTWFFFVFLGSPLAGLIRFPYTSQFELPTATLLNGVTGIVLCVIAVFVAVRHWERIRTRRASSLLFLGFTLFAMGSSLLTGWGRAAFDSYGVANANGSRYAIFSSYLLYALLYVAADPAKAHKTSAEGTVPLLWAARVPALGFVSLMLLASYSYARSVPVYRGAHEFNQVLANAYNSAHNPNDQYIYPNAQVATELKAGLQRLRIGPYRLKSPELAGPLLQELSQNSLEDTFHINGLRVDPALGDILFAHPHSRFSLPVSSRTEGLTVEFGILDGGWKAVPPTDGVEFRISLRKPGGDSESLWDQWLHPSAVPSDRGPHAAMVPLHAPDGSSVIFETSPGPAFENDWAYWTKLEIRGTR